MNLTSPEPTRHAEPTARAVELTHLVFARPELEAAEAFLVDFGLTVASRGPDVLYLRGAAPTPYCYRVHRGPRARFVGLGFAVDTREELVRLSRLEGATAIAPAAHPGGGECTVLRDPSGFAVEVVHGRAPGQRSLRAHRSR